LSEEEKEDLDIGMLELAKNDCFCAFVFKCQLDQCEKIYPELEKIFPNIWRVFQMKTDLDDRLIVASERRLKEKALANGRKS